MLKSLPPDHQMIFEEKRREQDVNKLKKKML
jgi:hypothetical protein